MELTKDYDSLEDTLLMIKVQISESIDQIIESDIQPPLDAEELFYWLKDRTTYMNDPNSIELLMTYNTLMSGSRTGVAGGGDCDDFTIAAVASLLYQGFRHIEIVLAGNDKDCPVHIYCRLYCFEDIYCNFDLTEDHFDQIRPYKYVQNFPFSLDAE